MARQDAASPGMKIAFLEPFFGGSHASFAEGWKSHSRHEIELFTLPARKWKWRMRGSAVAFAERLRGEKFDAVFATDYVNLAELLGLLPEFRRLPAAAYFHENQLTYPVREESERDYQFAFTNITTCLAASRVFFNSAYHRNEFLQAVPRFLKRLPDCEPPPSELARRIAEKSKVLYLGADLAPLLSMRRERSGPLTVLWNHRWEYDKGPDELFAALGELRAKGAEFRLIVCGQSFRHVPEEFERARVGFAEELIHFGTADRAEYTRLLAQTDVVVSTAVHEFFGLSVVEAMAAGACPLLPDRLSYPELLTPELAERSLYRTRAQLVKKLRDFCSAPEKARAGAEEARACAERFDWSARVRDFDDAAEALASGA